MQGFRRLTSPIPLSFIHSSIYIYLVVLPFNLRASHLLRRHSTTWATPPTLLPLVFFFREGLTGLGLRSIYLCLLSSWDYKKEYSFKELPSKGLEQNRQREKFHKMLESGQWDRGQWLVDWNKMVTALRHKRKSGDQEQAYNTDEESTL
jgi:hypothetical protein